MYYITSDPHWYHDNICGDNGFVKSRRIFKDSISMTETYITNWNSRVTSTDTTYILGDLSIKSDPELIFNVLKRLNGTLILIKGNHCVNKYGEKLYKYLTENNYQYNGKPKYEIHEFGIRLKMNKKSFYLSHYPLGIGNFQRNLRVFCGHIHENVADAPNVLNVCWDSPELGDDMFYPIPLLKAIELVETKFDTFHKELEQTTLVNSEYDIRES